MTAQAEGFTRREHRWLSRAGVEATAYQRDDGWLVFLSPAGSDAVLVGRRGETRAGALREALQAVASLARCACGARFDERGWCTGCWATEAS